MATATRGTHGTTNAPTVAPSTTVTTTHTPLVVSSKVVRILVYIALIVVLLISLIIVNNKRKTKEKVKEIENEAAIAKMKAVNDKLSVYDLSKISYGDSLIIQINPGFSGKVELTNDWCPYWSSGPVDTYDEMRVKRILDKNRFIQGPPLSRKSSYFEFKNTGTYSIIIKIGRCKSIDNCTVMF